MTMKDSYGFESKALAREKEKEFVGKHYSEKERKNLKILTLLGHEDYELKQIWDPLGVPRKNITAVEINPKAYEIIKSKDLGINLIKGNIDSYITETDKNFDVINLDYPGYFNEKKRENIINISLGKKLGDRGILCNWVSGRMEDPYTKDVLNVQKTADLVTTLIALRDNPGKFSEEKIKKSVDEVTSLNPKKVYRSDAITSRISCSLLIPRILNPLIKILGLEEEMISYIEKDDFYRSVNKYNINLLKNGREKELIKKLGEEEFLAFRRLCSSGERREKLSLDDRLILASPSFNGIGALKLKELVAREVRKRIGKDVNKHSPTFCNTVADALILQAQDGYMILDSERYLYHSDKGTPMDIDFFLVGKNNFKDISYEIKNGRFRLHIKDLNKPLDLRRTNRLNSFIDARNKTHALSFPERIELIPEKKEDYIFPAPEIPQTALSKEDVYSLLREGKTKEEIIDIDPSTNPNKIRSYQAHITMDKMGIKKGRPRKQKDKDLEKEAISIEPQPLSQSSEPVEETLSKEDVIWLLKQGFSTKEILSTYPNSFTDYQLRAYKAHVTQGAYK